ncbi:hypothetical protein AB0D74_45450 [Streptomyces sp. NPDC048278]|uniref:hypothetical protein n=1 Tax=unclassified Streptomyces TaxID=2593676 RepID=UPI003427694B
MSTPFVGMIAGTALAFAGRFGRFGAFLPVGAPSRWAEGGGWTPPAVTASIALTVLPAPHGMMAEATSAAEPYTTHARIRLSAASHRTPHVR